MKRIRWDWRLLKLIALSRGFTVKEIPGQLPEKKFKNRKGLAESTLHAKAKKGAPAPRKIAEYLMSEEGLPTRKGYERTAKVVRLGLAVLSGLPSPTVARKLDALSSNLDTTHAKIDSNGGKLDALLTEVAAIRAVLKGGLHVTGTVLGILLLVGLLNAGGHQIRADASCSGTTSATQLPPVSDVAHGATGAAGIGAYLRAVLGGVLDMGKKTEENWIPKNPYPGQKLAKDCKASLAEDPFNGGCWVETKIAPPCGELFRHGDKCYRPVAADPTKPVGLVRVVPGHQ